MTRPGGKRVGPRKKQPRDSLNPPATRGLFSRKSLGLQRPHPQREGRLEKRKKMGDPAHTTQEERDPMPLLLKKSWSFNVFYELQVERGGVSSQGGESRPNKEGWKVKTGQ